MRGEERGGSAWGRLVSYLLTIFLLLSVGSTSSSPALLGIREARSEYDRTQPSLQYYNSPGDLIAHKDIYTGKAAGLLTAAPKYSRAEESLQSGDGWTVAVARAA